VVSHPCRKGNGMDGAPGGEGASGAKASRFFVPSVGTTEILPFQDGLFIGVA